MKKPTLYEGGSLFTIRLPNDTPEIVLTTLNELKQEHGRGFTSKIIDMWNNMFIEGKQIEDKHYLHLPIPSFLTEDQRKTLESKEFQDTMSSLAYFLLTKTVTQGLQNAPVYFGGVPTGTTSVITTPIAEQQSVQTFEKEEIKTENPIEVNPPEEVSKEAIEFATKFLFDDDDDE